ncbi:GCN5-related N-acetyltransferase [Oscillochloris trichoides DG-6]|uniref:GCN5-related N-acetyltransferase n=1 Tax=Oscillochloris trichoides DG-6 TaxID=765420 RepID=E1IAR3_9CHLR|nr:GNAT family N-acetyltransferase [Oscillochloris trichoides]EFO81742.1 GCN5-related N-acetyltransferase [Oscillochloris trichoides DG-6]
MQHDIRPISAAQTRPLRQRVLRPFLRLAELVYPGDDHPLALHAGAFLDERLVGVASIAPEACPAAPEQPGWRLRGMAIVREAQRQGYGAALIGACIAHARQHGGALLWCNGRSSAMSFYTAQGFVVYGHEFDIAGTGPHYLFWRVV